MFENALIYAHFLPTHTLIHLLLYKNDCCSHIKECEIQPFNVAALFTVLYRHCSR